MKGKVGKHSDASSSKLGSRAVAGLEPYVTVSQEMAHIDEAG